VEVRLAADLGVGAEDAAVALHRVRDRAALGDRERDGLLEGDVLAGAGGGDRHGGVPVIGRRDHDRVDVGPGQHVTEILIHRAAPVGAAWSGVRVGGLDPLPGLLGAPAVHVAHRHHLHLGRSEEHGEVGVGHLPAGADERDVDAVARGHGPAGADRQDERSERGRSSQPAEKTAAAQGAVAGAAEGAAVGHLSGSDSAHGWKVGGSSVGTDGSIILMEHVHAGYVWQRVHLES